MYTLPGRVLLVVDMLNDFIREDGALYSGPEAVKIVDKGFFNTGLEQILSEIEADTLF